MTPTEHIVDVFFNEIKNCFTISDVKVEKGNNRQFDLLAYEIKSKTQYHIEISVTHNQHWTANLTNLNSEIEAKFFGNPKNNRPGNQNTDFAKGKSYLDSIKNTYEKYGFDYEKVIRVWVLWYFKDTPEEIEKWKSNLASRFQLEKENFELYSFRDQILKSLFEEIGTSNYSDDVMRTLSLMKEYKRQGGILR